MTPTNPFSANEVEASFGGRYVFGSELRVGGQGVVYRAKRVRLPDGSACSDEVALKLHLDAKQDKRVEREIEAMKYLRHPALATLLEEGTISIAGKQTRYIAWELSLIHILTLKLTDFVIPIDDVPEDARKAIKHWSQIIDYWAVDWDFRDDTFHNQWQSYRTRQESKIELSTKYEYEASGSYKVVVKVIDKMCIRDRNSSCASENSNSAS